MKTTEIKLNAEQLIILLKQLSVSQQAYVNGYVQALADEKQSA